MKKKFKPYLGQTIKKMADKTGVQVNLEPEWNVVGQIKYKNGKKKYEIFR